MLENKGSKGFHWTLDVDCWTFGGFIGFIEFIGFVGFIEFIGFVGFIEFIGFFIAGYYS